MLRYKNMGGGLMQLVAYGAQDIYLTGNPQITFFKVVYRRHTNFSMESIKQTFSGNAGFGNDVTATISRNGDLIHKVYVRGVSSSANTITSDGNALVNQVELEIGGQKIDKHYGHRLTAWHELTSPNTACSFPAIPASGTKHATSIPVGVATGAEMQVRPTQEQSMAFHCKATTVGTLEECSAWVPLQFWFSTNPGLALPLIALQYHEVKLIVQFRQFDHLYSCLLYTSPSPRD